MNEFNIDGKRTVFWVTITQDHHFELYKKLDIPSKVFLRWYWYFEYRAALFKVKYPRCTIKIATGSHVVEDMQAAAIELMQARIKRQRNSIAADNYNLRMARDTWNGMFPISEDPDYQRALEKAERKIIKCFEWQMQFLRMKSAGWSQADIQYTPIEAFNKKSNDNQSNLKTL